MDQKSRTNRKECTLVRNQFLNTTFKLFVFQMFIAG